MPKETFVINAVVDKEDIAVEDGGHARICTVYPDGDTESGIFVRVQSWDDSEQEDFIPSHPDWDRLFDKCEGRKSLFTGKKKVTITIEVEDA